MCTDAELAPTAARPPPRALRHEPRRARADEAVRIVAFIKRAQELGFTLREAKQLLKLRGAGPLSAV
ncbi:MerR family DNA-binding protein [Sorangium sp. So ce1078]|uniref:MerR family DNA-binding protein n=1 Tax=Sorangium sp. So ce1078 TaxID=3133329 RepID=UPI003F6188DE